MARSPIPDEDWLEAEAAYRTGGSPLAMQVLGQHGHRPKPNTVRNHMNGLGIPAGALSPEVEPSDDEITAEVASERKLESMSREIRIWKRKYEEAVKRQSLDDVITQLMADYRQSMPAPKVRQDNRPNAKEVIEETIILNLSDLHVGETVDGEAMQGLNKYDIDVFLARMEALDERLINICFGALKGYKFRRLRVYMLGDLINGQFGAMHDELIITEASSLMETVYGTAYVLVQFLARMLQWFEEIVVCAAPGNHGRMTKKPWAKNAEMNWDIIVPQIVSTYFANNDRVTFKIPTGFFFIDEVENQRILGLHGHQVKGWAGIPWYGINRVIGNLTEVLQHRDLAIDHVMLGHFHTEAIFDRIGGEIIANPCMKGADEFTLSAGFKPANAGQTMFGLHKDHGVTHRWRIDLQQAYEPQGLYSWYPGGSLGEIWKKVVA